MMENADRRHAVQVARMFLDYVRDWDYCLVDEVAHGSVKPFTEGYKVEHEEPGVKVYVSKDDNRIALIVAKAHGINYLHRLDYRRFGK